MDATILPPPTSILRDLEEPRKPSQTLLTALTSALHLFRNSILSSPPSPTPSTSTLSTTEIHPDATFLNAQNHHSDLPVASDVLVVGAGIHSLIYSIHLRLRSQSLFASNPSLYPHPPSITILERLNSPGYKIGESTLTTFGVWLKSIGLSTSVLWRLFGAKDGLAFYYLEKNGEFERDGDGEENGMDGIGKFCANGPRGDFVATLQIERKVSELLLTLYAQRLGVRVLHGTGVDVAATSLDPGPNPNSSDIPTALAPDPKIGINAGEGSGKVKLLNGQEISTRLLVDATGRFRRFASKKSKSKRFEGFNTDSFWAYFEMEGDEADLPFENYESCHTNHICLAEGWAWIIRLPTWEDSTIPNLTAMINHLLDLNQANTPSDSYPSMLELAEKFDCKVRWVTSIGYALRSDVVYPPSDELKGYGTCEAERKFNWITSKYPRMQAFMDRHRLVKDLYGKNTTWFIRKQLTYSTPIVSGVAKKADGMAWAAIGDAAGFTNPLYSPGINCNMATSIFLAEKTPYLLSRGVPGKEKTLAEYDAFCAGRVENLHRMNMFNYVLMQSPRTGPLGPLWQYLSGTGNALWRRSSEFVSVDKIAEFVTTWEWGSQHPEYIMFAKEVIRLLGNSLADGPPDKARVEEVLRLSDNMLAQAKQSGKYVNRWAGLFSWYDDELRFDPLKKGRDKLAVRCEGCGNWRILTGVSIRCCTCGVVCKEVDIVKYEECMMAP